MKERIGSLENIPNEENLIQAVAHIIDEEYSDAYRTLRPIIESLEQREEMVDRVEGRLKNPGSVKDKMIKKGIGLEQLREQILDIIGFRIIVHFLEDIPDIIAALRKLPGLELSEDERFEDYITKPKITGYRSIHINAAYHSEGGGVQVPFEIQIRTTLQHAWATKSHLLVYKIDDIPERWQKHFKILGDQLFLSDEVAELLRTELK